MFPSRIPQFIYFFNKHFKSRYTLLHFFHTTQTLSLTKLYVHQQYRFFNKAEQYFIKQHPSKLPNILSVFHYSHSQPIQHGNWHSLLVVNVRSKPVKGPANQSSGHIHNQSKAVHHGIEKFSSATCLSLIKWLNCCFIDLLLRLLIFVVVFSLVNHKI